MQEYSLISRFVTSEAHGAPTQIIVPSTWSDTFTLSGMSPPSDIPAQAHLPGLVPAMPSQYNPVPHSWLSLLEQAGGDRRNRADAVRALRLAILITSRPRLRDRHGKQRVILPVRKLIEFLWPGDRAISRRLIPLQRTLYTVDHWNITATDTKGHQRLLFPVRLATWQPLPNDARDVDTELHFNVTYPIKGSNGAIFDRGLMRAASHEVRALTYFVASWASDAPYTKRGTRPADMKLADFVRLVYHGRPEPRSRSTRRDRRDIVLDALAWLAAWRPYDSPNAPSHFEFDHVKAQRGSDDRLFLVVPRLSLPSPDPDLGSVDAT